MKQLSYSQIIFSKPATWTLRISALLAVFLFVKFVYPSMDFYADADSVGFGYPTYMGPIFSLFVISAFVSIVVIASRAFLAFVVPWWRQRDGA